MSKSQSVPNEDQLERAKAQLERIPGVHVTKVIAVGDRSVFACHRRGIGHGVAVVATEQEAMRATYRSIFAAQRYGARWPVLPLVHFVINDDAVITFHLAANPIQPGKFDAYRYGKALFAFHQAGERWMNERVAGEMWQAMAGADSNRPFVKALLTQISDISTVVAAAYAQCHKQMSPTNCTRGKRGILAFTIIHGDPHPGNVVTDRLGDYRFIDLCESGLGMRDSDFAALAYLVMMKGMDPLHFEAMRRGYGRFAPPLAEMREYVIDSVIYRLGLALALGPASPVFETAGQITRQMAECRYLPAQDEWKSIADVVEPGPLWQGDRLGAPLTSRQLTGLKMSSQVPTAIAESSRAHVRYDVLTQGQERF